jgi:hypothetical protein
LGKKTGGWKSDTDLDDTPIGFVLTNCPKYAIMITVQGKNPAQIKKKEVVSYEENSQMVDNGSVTGHRDEQHGGV